jgi:tRNA A-37 threonylcarbamoyl transferase component Bud32
VYPSSVIGPIELDSATPFAGRYRVVRRIASGGMGAVFEVVHIETQRRRALKVMLPELVEHRELRDRFQMEARITARVDSEYIVDVFDAGIDERTGMPFLVMELLQGEEVGDILQRAGPMSPQLVVTYLRQVASALDKTHAAGIVHRDLKPENLFLTHREDGTPRIKILDFGISKVVSEANTASNTTRSLGTPLYMAPEQVLGQPVGPATDLYSVGLIAYTMLVGFAYWHADTDKFDNAIAFALHTTKGTTDSAEKRAAELGRSLPPQFDVWFRRATHSDPAQRFRRASEAINELAAVLGGPDASGIFAPVVSSGPRLALASYGDMPTMIAAGTAPGTELDRSGTLSGAKRRFGALPWLVVAVLVACAALTGALLLHSRATVASADASSSAPSAAPLAVAVSAPPAAPVSVAPVAALPAATASAAAAAAEPSAAALPVAHGKPTTALKGKPPPSKVGASSPLAPAPKYTRD